MPRNHDKEKFYKYVTATTAEKILNNSKLRWSAPHLFNDPFDHQISYNLNFDSISAEKEILKVFDDVTFGDCAPVFLHETPLNRMSLFARALFMAGQQNREAAVDALKEALEGYIDVNEYMEKINQTLTDFLAHSRVFCMSETHDNVVMWSHYADEHKGAVIRLSCVDEIGDNFLIAKPVAYTERFPDFIPLSKWVGQLFALEDDNYGQMAFDLAYLKHTDWSYEQEWRVHIPLQESEPVGDGVSFYEKDKLVFGAIYFGCRMPDGDKRRLSEIVNRLYPDMKIFEAKKSDSSFSLEFNQVRAST